MANLNANVTETTWRDIDNKKYRVLIIKYKDGSGETIKPELPKRLM
jgi:hypothetical protein